ncbi:DUF6731 family protein [Geovibrio ferrireducens]|uniref:DUF6731 family protein n=1 Tax=Geovibrio ferrireducens TaxID=46201 RepID=UPI0022461003|nr:DUF6731 family protein [Geovibrio ferrireducens]
MAEKKRINVNFFNIESQEDGVFMTLSEKLSTLFESGMDYGFFETKSREIMFKLFESFEVNSYPAYLFGLIKEKSSWPVWYDRNGELSEVPLNSGTLGDITYGLALPQDRLILTASGTAGKGAFTEFLRWLADDSTVILDPVFIGDAYNKIQNWEVFRKFEISVEAPTADFVDTVLTSESGREFGSIMGTLEGLKMDITVSMGNTKGSMSAPQLKALLGGIISDNYAKKLTITGKGFEDEASESIDVMSAKLKYSADVAVSKTYLSPDEARTAFLEGYYNNQQYLVKD